MKRQKPSGKQQKPPNETRNEILYLADSLIRSKGFNGFSYKNIGGIMDVRNAAIHYHFPVKSDLGIAVIEAEMQEMTRNKQNWRSLPGEEQLKGIVDIFFQRSRRGTICLTGALTPAYSTYSDDMQHHVGEMCRSILDWMTACLEKGRKEGKFYFHGDAADRALLVTSTLLSALLLSRILGREIFDRMIDQQFKDLGSALRVDQFEEDVPEHLLG